MNMNHPRAHRHGIHCLHTRGWYVQRWCLACRRHFLDSQLEMYSQEYERLADAALVDAIFTELEDGELEIPARILNLDLTDVGIDKPRPAEPSAN
jgi:hypothetical protein